MTGSERKSVQAEAAPKITRGMKRHQRAPYIQPRVLTLPEIAVYLGVSERIAYRLIVTGQIPVIRFPNPDGAGASDLRAVRVDRKDLDEFVEKCRQPW